jgi:PEP-CTERM motif
MPRFLKVLGGGVCLALVLVVNRANATIAVAQLDTTSGPAFTSWLVTPNAADSTAYTSNVFVSYAANLPSFNSAENNYGGPPAALSQSFQATTGGTLSDIQIVVGGNPNGVTLNLALYDAGVAPGSPSLVDTGSNSYSPGASGVSNNLLSAVSQAFVLPGYNTQGAVAAIFDFQFSGADAVNLTAGDEYVFELNTPSANQIWYRMAANGVNYPQGQAFRGRAPLNGNPARDMSLAVTVVPEPGTFILLGLAAPAMLWAARKRK